MPIPASRSPRGLSLLLLLLLVGLSCSSSASKSGARVLILTGEDAHHQWQLTTPVLQELLEEDARLQVDVLDDLKRITDTDFSAYDVVVIHFKNDAPDLPGRAAFDQLDAYVRGGGGLVSVHFGCGAFQEFRDDYESLVGRVWFGLPAPEGERHHDPYGPFEVRATESSHAVATELATFQTSDELYTCLTGSTIVDVVAEARSPVDQQDYPMAMVRQAGDGRVFLCTLGHDVNAYQASGMRELYRRGTAWAAGMTPTP